MGLRIFLVWGVLWISLTLAHAETVRTDENAEYVVHAVEIKPEDAPRIDGIWNDSVWGKGRAIAASVQRDPLAGEPATEASEIVVLYDPENLYVGCRLYDARPEHIINELRRRESVGSSDTIELLFDTFQDHRTGYAFAMNPSGVQLDALRFNDDQQNGSWDGIWKSAAGVDSAGWVAEFKIPLFNMRFPDTQEQAWDFNVQREIRYKAERTNWKPVSVNDRSLVRMSTLGHLVGIRGIRPGRNIELYPYGLAGFSDTFDSPMHSQKDVGFDVKYGLTSDVTLDLTVNPDFAQVEADVMQINIFSSWRTGQDLFTQTYVQAWQQNNPGTSIRKEYADGRLRSGRWLFDQAYGIRTTNEMNISWWYAVGKTNELNATYRSWSHGINISTPRSGSIQKILANFRASWGTFYNFSQKYLGKSWMIGGDETSWIRSNLGLELSCDYRKTFDPAGVRDGNHFRISMNNTLLLMKDLFPRLFTQGRWGTTYYGKKRIENLYLVSFLFGWEFNPGCWMYLAYNEGREDLNDLNDPAVQKRVFFQTDRTLIAKLQYALY